MSLNGFFARAKMRLGKLVPSFGFGGGATDISDLGIGCADIDVDPAFLAKLSSGDAYTLDLAAEAVLFTSHAEVDSETVNEADVDVEAVFIAAVSVETC